MTGLYITTGRLYCLLFTSLIIIFCISINIKINYHSCSFLPTTMLNKHYSSLIYSLAKYSSDTCQWKFDNYSPSLWEKYWYNNIIHLQRNVCSTLEQNDQMNKSISALEFIIHLQKTIFNQSSVSNKYDDLFSKIYYRFECSKSSQSNLVVSQYIEPLIGLLRDPLTICSYKDLPATLKLNYEGAMQSKRFFLLGPSAPYHNFQTSTASIAPWLYQQGSQKILMDIGSSYFNGMTNETKVTSTISARWFYEYFRLNSLHLDRIIAFEATQYPPRTYWNQIPDDIIGLFTFINTEVENKGKLNPWNILKSIAKVHDYVIIKLDIDKAILETELINQVLYDTSISSLIDEMFFEMHITVNEMRLSWGHPSGELKDTYILFTKLRQLGIRMHSWP